jgi:hypothetical protein
MELQLLRRAEGNWTFHLCIDPGERKPHSANNPSSNKISPADVG